ncbi:MAG: 50S ribosomal protein L15 [Myxococcota bacterium]|jgi:large subunit ribosomal protein L15|nr:50S ribosomal protein L15 [Myxococcota bacterium]OQC33941.1 MAG: 50S ribosomal protein L15 [Deltaproteobacteria bacterium ADurb.Bin058]HHW96982.1 50S ribosomal protein L15 [Oligoflexales bacterium]MBP8970290.1 50S ribosomal protein L15 [Myxococcota bacterium]HOE82560.1 50S ribosomal protein L15 [Myxococcota bacterium]
MKELSSLKPIPGSVKQRKRVGRGPGSGTGKTAARGHKGTGARTGKGRPAHFEGGQMPLQRRVPKRGFRPLDHKEFAVVNVGELDIFENGTKVDVAMLVTTGLVRKIGYGVKLLGNGDITRKLDIVVHACSATAREKVVAAGGTVSVLTEETGA